MEFGLSEVQRTLEETVQRFFDEQVSLDEVRRIAENPLAFDTELWQSIVDLGVLGVLVPEQYGGSGLNFFDASIILQAAGRCTLPAPLLGTMVMAPLALLEAGNEQQKARYLPQFAGGTCKVGVAVGQVTKDRENSGLTFHENTLSGKSLFVIDGGVADLYLVAIGDNTLVLVDRNDPGLTVESIPTIDKTRCVTALKFDKVAVELLGDEGTAAGTLLKMLDAGRLALAADTLGAAEVMVEKAVAYAKEREQFNRPIGSFQAVKHMCADMVAELEPARALVWYAAHAQDFVPEDARLMACHAKAHMSEVSTAIAKTAVEVHGGMGFTDLLGLHYWFKRIGLNRQLLGGPEQLREEAAVIQGWIAARPTSD